MCLKLCTHTLRKVEELSKTPWIDIVTKHTNGNSNCLNVYAYNYKFLYSTSTLDFSEFELTTCATFLCVQWSKNISEVDKCYEMWVFFFYLFWSLGCLLPICRWEMVVCVCLAGAGIALLINYIGQQLVTNNCRGTLSTSSLGKWKRSFSHRCQISTAIEVQYHKIVSQCFINQL